MRKKIIVSSVIFAGVNCGMGLAGMLIGSGSLIFPIAFIAGVTYLGLFAWANCGKRK